MATDSSLLDRHFHQTTSGDVLVTPTGGAQLRLADALGYLTVTAYGASGDGVTDNSAAFAAAFAALPTTGGSIRLGPGTFMLASPLNFSGKSYALTGAGKGVTTLAIAHSGIAITSTMTDYTQNIIMRDFSVVSSCLSGTNAVASITYPVSTSQLTSTINISSIDVQSNTDGTVKNTFQHGWILNQAWNCNFRDIFMSGQPQNPAVLGTSMFDLTQSYACTFINCRAFWLDALIIQSGYSEGIYIAEVSVAATNWLFRQAASGVVGTVGGLSLDELMVTDCEIDTFLGGLKVASSQLHFVKGCHFHSRLPGYVAYDYTDVQRATHVADVIDTDGGGTGNFGVRLQSVGGQCVHNTWTGPIFNGPMTAVSFGVGANLNEVRNATSRDLTINAGLQSNFVDAGANNRITWRSLTGDATLGTRFFSGSAGQTLVAIVDIPAAVNIVTLSGGATGVAPIVGVDGTSANVDLQLLAKGTGSVLASNLNLAGTGNVAGAWTAFSGTPSSQSGTLTTAAFTGQYKKFGRTVWFNLTVTVTTNGTGAGALRVSLPFIPAQRTIFVGRECLVTGKVVSMMTTASTALATINYYDNTYPGVDGAYVAVSGTYEATT